jgi:hypothetical protein
MAGSVFRKFRYGLTELANNYDDEEWRYNRLIHRIIGPTQRTLYNRDGIDVMDEEWDNLIILDACRADTFESVVGTDQFDEYNRVISRGSATSEWTVNNFNDEYGDTCYITANPWTSKFAADTFYKLKNVWLENSNISEEKIIQSTEMNIPITAQKVVTAESMNDAVRRMWEEHQNKRYIIHYFQPHTPYIGKPSGEVRPPEAVPEYNPSSLKYTNISKQAVLNSYRQNLQYVYQKAIKIGEKLGGRTVITSDHGELFGELLRPFPIRGYGHPGGLRNPDLIEVPWAVIDGERRDTLEESVSGTKVPEERIEEQLRHLGYKA